MKSLRAFSVLSLHITIMISVNVYVKVCEDFCSITTDEKLHVLITSAKL